ncbi:MAG: hypothetical protein ACYTGX_02690 [Planctomycetota bacterium]
MNRDLLRSVRAWLLVLAAVIAVSPVLAQDPPDPSPPATEPAEKPAEKPAEEPAEKPQDPPADPPEQPAEEPAEKPQDPPAEKPQDPPADKPADPAPAEPKAQFPPRALKGTDIICLIDTSRSVARADLKGERIAALQLLLAVMARHPGDRVAIARYAGDTATRDKSTLLDWTPIPAEAFGQNLAFDNIFDALQQAAAAEERASDWNAATDLALRALLDARGDATDRPLWILLVTDGELDPVEGDATPAAYLPEDPAAVNGDLRSVVTAAAEARFLENGLQQLVQPGVWVTPLRVGPGGGSRDLCALVAEHTGATVLNVNELGPLGVLEQVLAELPAGVHGGVELRPIVDETLSLEAATATHVVLPVPLAPRAAVTVVEVPDGAATVKPLLEGGEPGELRARTAFGGRHRIVAWHDAWGRDTAELTLPEAGTARVLHLSLLPYEARAAFADAGATPASPGGSVKLTVALHEAGNANPLEALAPFDDAEARVEVIDAGGNVAGNAAGPIFGEFTITGELEVAIPDSVRGACTLRVTVTAMARDAEGEPLYRSAPTDLQLPVRAPLLVRFAVPRPFVQQAVEVYGEPDGPRPAADALTVPIASAGADAVPVPVEWNAEAGRYEGVWIPAAVGPAKVVEGEAGAAVVKLAPGAECDVRPRTLDVAYAPKAPAGAATGAEAQPVALRRDDDGALQGRVQMSASLLQGENCSVVVSARGADGAPVEGFALAAEDGAAVADNRIALAGPAPQFVLVRFAGDPGEGVQLRFAATDLPGGAVTKSLAIGVPPSGLLKKVIGIVVGLLLLVAALFLFQRQTCPDFEDRQLRLHTPGRTAERTRYLREFPRAGMGRVGLGTTEAPRSVEFRLVGLRGITPIRCRITSRKPYIRIQVNGSDLQGTRDLKDGDQIVLKGATLALRYTYYEQEGPAGEQTRMLQRPAQAPTVAETADLTVAGEVLAPNEFVLVTEADLPYVLAGEGVADVPTVLADAVAAQLPPAARASAETGAFPDEDEQVVVEGEGWPVYDGPGEETGGYSGEATGEFTEDDEAAETLSEAAKWPVYDGPGEETGGYGDGPGEETGGYDRGPGEETGGYGGIGEETGASDRSSDVDATLGAETGWADEWASQLGEETGVEDAGSQLGEESGVTDADEVDNAQTLDESTQIDMSPLEGAPAADDDDGDGDRDEAAETLGDDNTLAPGSVDDDLPDFLR